MIKHKSKQKELRESGVWQEKFSRNVDTGAELHAKELVREMSLLKVTLNLRNIVHPRTQARTWEALIFPVSWSLIKRWPDTEIKPSPEELMLYLVNGTFVLYALCTAPLIGGIMAQYLEICHF